MCGDHQQHRQQGHAVFAAAHAVFADERLTFKLDVFNVFNSRTVTSVVETAETGQGSSLYDTVYKIPTGFQAPRSVRLMLQYAF